MSNPSVFEMAMHMGLPRLTLTIFGLAWLICIGAWVFAVIENRRMNRGEPGIFTAGLLVQQFTDPEFWQVRGSAQLQPFGVSFGQVIPLSEERIGFMPTARGPFDLRGGLLTYSGIISWTEGPAQVSIRTPIGIPIFLGAWVAGWLIYAIALAPAIQCPDIAEHCTQGVRMLLVQVLPALGVLGIAVLALAGIRERSRALYAEVREGLREQARAATETTELPASF